MADTKQSKRGLGRGFDSLIPQNFDTTLLEPTEKVQHIDVSKLSAGKHQPRTTFDDEALNGLAESIKQYGIIQPLVITPAGKDLYFIVAGERRWRASQLAGLTKVPAIVRSSKELEQLEIALIENVQRVDLSPLEQAVSIERLHEQFNLGYDAIAKRLGKAISTVNNIVRLLHLPEPAREALEAGRITEGHARAILALKDSAEAQTTLLELIVKHDWSVRQAERFVSSHKEGIQERAVLKARVDTETPATKALSKRLKTPVHIRRTARGGKLELGFASDGELNRLLELLGKL
jgi:ParB family chromosome partitioning protein